MLWSPVPGASRYEVQVGPYDGTFGCNWSGPITDETATTAWTPLTSPSSRVGPSAWPSAPAGDTAFSSAPPYVISPVTAGTTWCVRVLARSDDDAKGNQVVSDWTQVGGAGMPAFKVVAPPPPGPPGPGGLVTPASAYVQPAAGTITPRTPLFTWNAVAGAAGYFVVVSRDAGFTQVADLAFTNIPAYAPRLANQEPLADETSGYYWAVIPTAMANGSGVYSNPPGQDSPQVFTKSSTPPTPSAPINGVTVSAQPTFSWTPAESARNYTLQVSEDPSFGNPIDNITTDSTAYTSSSTYPADTVLYWRVRANDWTGQGLNWSATATFRRTLAIPVPANDNPTGGEAIPALSWAPVQGAISYDVHVDQADGTTRDFTVDSTSFTPTLFYGLGVWRWQVRADFPTASLATVAGGYSPLQTFVRSLAAPADAHGVKTGTRIMLSWHPDSAAKQYEVDVSTTSGFSTTIDTHRVDGTTWAPDIDFTQTANQGALYWRVAAVDQGSNVGKFASGSFSPPRPGTHCTSARSKGKHRRSCAGKPLKSRPGTKTKRP